MHSVDNDVAGWEALSTGRSSNGGLESWMAEPDGSFRPVSKDPTLLVGKGPSILQSCNHENRPRKPTMAEIKANGRAKLKAAKAALAAEEAAQQRAEDLWSSGGFLDFIYDSTADAARSADFWRYLEASGVRGKTVLVVVPGFASWRGLTQDHVDRWNEAGLLAGSNAFSLVLKWPCGNVTWTAENAFVEAAAAWQ